MSFRSKVLNALDIKKDHVKIPVYQTFLNPSETNAAIDSTAADTVVAGLKPYAVSRCINDQIIGPKKRTERLEVLGFVVGDDPGNLGHLPDALDRDFSAGTDYSGIHYLGGLYDSSNRKLMKMRKSAITPPEFDTLYQPGAAASVAVVNDHTHSDWPNSAKEQAIILNDDPSADALYYHKTQIRFLLTGIDDISASLSGDQASNHRGTVRMLVLRPRVPAIRTRVDGTTGDFIINHDYMPNWHTELFYDSGKQLGGKLDAGSHPHTLDTASTAQHPTHVTTGSTLTPGNLALQPETGSEYSSHVVTYGLTKAALPNPDVELDTGSAYYGHMKVTAGNDHILTPADLLMSKINRQKYAVLHDEVFTLDSLHHGAAAQHIANVTIPYNKKVKFAGRIPLTSTLDTSPNTATVMDQLSHQTFDTPMNMASRPIILFLSYNQKISANIEGFTTISEC